SELGVAEQGGRGEELATVNDPVHGRGDFGEQVAPVSALVRKPGEQELRRRRERADGGEELWRGSGGLEGEAARAVGLVDEGAGLEAACASPLGPVEQIELERGASGVEDEEQHQPRASRCVNRRASQAPSRIAARTRPKGRETGWAGMTARAGRIATMPAPVMAVSKGHPHTRTRSRSGASP